MTDLYVSKELLNIILEYDGRIKYKNGKYINVIHKNDERYNIIKPIIIDDLLATGGTIIATANLLRKNFDKFDITAASIINLGFLPGEANLKNNNIKYSGLETYE